MMLAVTDYIEFDPCPVNEDCVQLDPNSDYMPAMRAQARRMVELLEKKFPDVTGDFKVARVEHDFGTYLEVRYYHADDEAGYAEANHIEGNYPRTWNDSTPVPMPKS